MQPFDISMPPKAQTHVFCAVLLTPLCVICAVFDTPGHTRGHITLSFPQASAVFPGGPCKHCAAADQQYCLLKWIPRGKHGACLQGTRCS